MKLIYKDNIMLLLRAKERIPYLCAVVILACWYGFDVQRGWIIEKLSTLMDQQPSWALHVLFIIGLCVIFTYFCQNLIVKEKYLSHQFRAFWYSIIAVYLYYRIENFFDFRGFEYGIAYMDLLLLWGYFLFCYEIFRLYHSRSFPVSNNGLIGDSPIRNAEEDQLGYSDYALAVAQYVNDTDCSKSSFSIGIEGAWGQGKTSFVNLLKQELEKHGYIIVDFNARASASCNEIQEDFLVSLRNSLRSYYVGISGIIKKYGKALQVTEEYNPALKFFQIGSWPNLTSSWETLDKAIKNTGRRIVVCIDDLDRLTGEEIMEVCKVIDKNGSFPNVFYIVSYDKEYVQSILSSYLEFEKSGDFLDKYINIEFSLPKKVYLALLEELLKYFEYSVSKNEFVNVNIDQIKQFFSRNAKVIELRLSTIRDIKRFYNQFRFDYQPVQNDVRFEDYFLLEIIKYKYKGEYEKLRSGEYTSEGADISNKEINHNKELVYLNCIDDKEKEPQCWDILLRLFPLANKMQFYNGWYQSRWNRICSVLSYERYFYQHSDGIVYNKDLQGLFQMSLENAVKKVNSWKDNVNDVREFLLTRDAMRLNSRKNFDIFIPLTIYCAYIYNDYVLRAALGTFFVTDGHDKGIEKIKKIYEFKDDNDYILHLKSLLSQLAVIDIRPVYSYVHALYTSMIDEPLSIYHSIINIEDCKDFLMNLLKEYLAQIDDETWSAQTAWEISRISKMNPKRIDYIEMDNDAINAIKDSMEDKPEKYAGAIITHFTFDGYLKFNICNVFLAYQIFGGWENFEEYLQVIEDSEKVPSLVKDVLKLFWVKFKKTEYNPVTFDGHDKQVSVGDYEAYYKIFKSIY